MQENKRLTLGSLFDGSGGFPLGGMLAGVVPVWASEIEPFPIRVTTKRLPFMKHYGDVSKMDGAKIEPVDIITFGSPCTDLSVAGKRAGLDGEQSGLFFEAIRITKEMRCATNGKYPRFIVWENVPGAFSSNKGKDFKAVLEAIIGITGQTAEVPMPPKDKWAYADTLVGDGWSIAYRTLDAQYWGVPQRRRRIFLVADFASGCAGKILFESEGLSRYSAESFGAWQRATRCTEGCLDETSECVNIENHPCDSRVRLNDDGVVQTLSSRMGTGGGNVPLIMNPPKAYGICSTESNAMKSDNPHSGIYEAKTSRTIDKSGTSPTCNQGGIAVVCVDQGGGKSSCSVSRDLAPTLACTHGGEPVVCVKDSEVYSITTGYYMQVEKEKAPTLLSRDYKDAACVSEPCFGIDRAAFNQGKNAQYKPSIEKELAPTLVAKGPGALAQPVSFYPQMKAECQSPLEDISNTLVNGTNPGYQNGVVETSYMVRRLTPTECARLQGFPDWWCSSLETPDPSNDELRFWMNVFETYRQITELNKKPKTLKQIIRWLKDPYADASEYKMWGNGVALPCVYFVLSGIVYHTQLEP